MRSKRKINNLVLLVGGLGTRLRSVVANVPKPMAPVKNKPFLKYVLDYWYDRGVRNFYLLVGYKGFVIEKYFGSKFKDSNIFYCFEKKLAGTGGALKIFFMKDKNYNQDEDFILVNGDTWLDIDMHTLTSDKEKNKNKNNLIIAVNEIPVNDRYGTLNIKKNKILEISPSNNKKAFINSGLYIFKPKILIEYLKKQEKHNFSFEVDILPALIKDGKVLGSFCVKNFLDIGVPRDYSKTIDILG